MAQGKWLEKNKGARAAMKKGTADYKAKWADEKKARAADRLAVMTGEK